MIIKKGQKFRFTNINPDWDSMGISMNEWNESDNNPKVINGEIYVYNEKFCNEHEVIRESWKIHKRDMDSGDIVEDFCGYRWGSYCYDKYGLCVDDGVEVVPISEDEHKEDCESVIDIRNI